CHPSKNGPWSSLGGAVREEFRQDIIRFVYRLDRETSGVIVLAKTEATGGHLQGAVHHRKIGKLYVVILEGEMREPVTVNQPLGPDPTVNVTVKQRVTAGAGSQEAISIFHPLAVRGGHTLAGVQLRTGRKHQIRAHAEWLGNRVVGDKLYGPDPGLYLEFAINGWTARHSELLSMPRQALHCAAIDLRPTGLNYIFRAPWPTDMARFAELRMGLSPDEGQQLLNCYVEEKHGEI
ncbi:MAG TPA: RNA pseudouridine synthase, partial [Terriglobia bacterium]|nr:RNA pseudouridine synthase [Terriglobia bacterium]